MTEALTIHNLRKTYDNGFEAIKGIDLSVAPGDFFALLGPNGAGKSTTIGIITSLVNKTSGDVEIFGFNTDRQLVRAKSCIGVVPQEFNFNQFEKVGDIVVTQAGYYGIPARTARQRAARYLKQLGLWDKRDIPSRMLSGGMKRRLMIARALMHKPKLLILDEPTAGVDIELRRHLWSFIGEVNDSGTTVILTTHYLEEAEQMCRNVAIINQGEIVESTSVKKLLRKLDREVFYLDIRAPLPENAVFADYQVRAVDPHTLEAEVVGSRGLNGLFEQLNRFGVDVVSMRNKVNRLEELFLGMTGKGSGRDA